MAAEIDSAGGGAVARMTRAPGSALAVGPLLRQPRPAVRRFAWRSNHPFPDLESALLTAPAFRSIEGAYVALLQLATEEPEQHIDTRGNAAREVIGVSFRLPTRGSVCRTWPTGGSTRSFSSPKPSGTSQAAGIWR
ncbi:hypothetical protein [Streptomyces sp. NPDC056405]|uniref:hypothetical protein n=1 Tax=Streptomyces sp. NPDC056405 TaxID=3345811 RepID=UPI0035DC942F